MTDKAVALISGGIDSVVAAYLIQRQGVQIIPIYCDNSPFSGETTKKRALDVIKRLATHASKPLRTYIVPNGETQIAILKNTPRKMTCIFCRRTMLRIAEKIAKKEKAGAVITGEAMGQKASQTLANMLVTTETISLPVLRPLLGLDKIEIEKIGKEIGTFELSIQPAVCCTITPEKPSTAADLRDILEIEKDWDYKKVVDKAVKESTVVETS
ncbi:tRNA sulfurtransferase [uncultured archaeon]|nr:tRNA sulfurtransferase [uncultured archaeon]